MPPRCIAGQQVKSKHVYIYFLEFYLTLKVYTRKCNLFSTPIYFCLPEAGDIVTLPMKSVSLVVAYSSMLFLKLFHSPALPRAPSIAYHLSVDWHHSKRCVYLFIFLCHENCVRINNWYSRVKLLSETNDSIPC